jgi:hypothetical protein
MAMFLTSGDTSMVNANPRATATFQRGNIVIGITALRKSSFSDRHDTAAFHEIITWQT